MDFSQIQLIYRAEGNANLVLALPQHKKVLRLPKATLDGLKSTVALMDINTSVSRRDFLDLLVLCLADEQTVDAKDHVAYMGLMTRLLGEEYAYRPETVGISSTERDRLNRFSMSYRPAERLDKEFCGQFGLLLPDATLLPDDLGLGPEGSSGDTYSIEIKPKQGWRLQGASLPDLFQLRGLEECRFCCMQYLKLKHHKVSKLSSFCPLDLFSGQTARMKRALQELFKAPQNNLRVFKNGALMHSNDRENGFRQDDFATISPDGNISFLYDLVIKCLLKNYCDPSLAHVALQDEPNLSAKLPAGSILRKVLNLQLLAKRNLPHMATGTYKTEKSYFYLRDLLSKQITSSGDLSPKEQYMIGATAMDCSIMVTFHEVNDSYKLRNLYKRLLIKHDGRTFVTKVTAVDLDPKSDNHFAKFVKQTNEAYAATEEFLGRCLYVLQ